MIAKAAFVQGLFRRSDWQDAVKVPLALVPGGSGNALSASTGLWTPVTAAHAGVCRTPCADLSRRHP